MSSFSLLFVGPRALRGFVVTSVLFTLWLLRPARAADLTLPITADNSICAYPSEQNDNMGAARASR